MPRHARTPILHVAYHRYVSDQDCARYGQAVARRYTIGTLERLVVASDRTTRRAAVLALGLMADYRSNATLAKALHDTDRGVRMMAETGIQELWRRAGSPRDRKRLRKVVDLITVQRYAEAVAWATKFIDESPWLPECRNQRAVALFRLGCYTESIRDCKGTLEMNPHHFGAAAGMGQCLLKMNNRAAALECFRHALQINPNLDGIRAQVVHLQRQLKSQE
jgi:tetratricopeptide (TPR) repeat protein